MTDGQYYGARKLCHNIAAIYCCVCHRPNANSLLGKLEELKCNFNDSKYHIIAITETWANKDITDAEYGYTLFRKDRLGASRSGGLLLYVKEDITSSQIFLLGSYCLSGIVVVQVKIKC